VKQIHTDCINVSGELPGDACKHVLEIVIGGAQGKRKYCQEMENSQEKG
jgi:hypothetical protein